MLIFSTVTVTKPCRRSQRNKQQKKCTAIFFLVHLWSGWWSALDLDSKCWTWFCFQSYILVWKLASGFGILKQIEMRGTQLDFKWQAAQLQLPQRTAESKQRLSRQTRLKSLPRDGTLKQQVLALRWTVAAQDSVSSAVCGAEMPLGRTMEIRFVWRERTGFAEKAKGRSGN